MNLLIEQANCLLKNHPFTYAFCGGWAIDMFCGTETRKHGDIDILAYWTDRNAIIHYMQTQGFEIYEMLGGGKVHHITDINNQFMVKRNIFCCKSDCELVAFYSTDETDIFYVDFKHIGLSKLNFIEFLFNDKTETDFLYARNHIIKRGLDKAILYYNGMPYLSPELCLLYKSTDTDREGYQQDYEIAVAKMDSEQREWLDNALSVMYPEGHRWFVSKSKQ